MPTGTSPFVEPTNVQWDSFNLYGIESIEITSNAQRVKTKDNGQTRYVASHVVFYEETVTLTSNDLNVFIQLQGVTGIHPLTFTYTAESQNINPSPLANQAVTIANVCWENAKIMAPSKAEGKYTFTGTILGVSGGTNPISIVAA